MSFPYYAERSRLFLWLSCVSDSHPIFPSVNWHWWHSGQSAESQYQFSTSPGLWFFFFPPLLILPPLLEHRIVVTSPIAFAVDQLALKYLLITPLAQPPFLWCSQMGQLSFYEWAVETHQCFFFFWCCCSVGLPTKPPPKAQLYWERASHFASDRSSAVFPVSQSPFYPPSSRAANSLSDRWNILRSFFDYAGRVVDGIMAGWSVSGRGCRAPHWAEMQTIIFSARWAAFTVTHFHWWRQSAVLAGLLTCLVGWCV